MQEPLGKRCGDGLKDGVLGESCYDDPQNTRVNVEGAKELVFVYLRYEIPRRLMLIVTRKSVSYAEPSELLFNYSLFCW